MNKVILIGRLTRDPELRYTPGGTAVANFDLAVNREFAKEGEEKADFIRIIVWQKQAENCANYLKKGLQVAVEGRLQIRSYETQDGQKRRVAEVVANHVQFLERAKDEASAQQPDKGGGDTSGVDLDNLPF